MHEWNERLEHADHSEPQVIKAIRADMDRGELEHRHLNDAELASAIRGMGKIAARLPRLPGKAADRLLAAMKL